MLICEGELYVDTTTIGPYKVYLALENASHIGNVVKVIELVSDTTMFLTSKSVKKFEGILDSELLDAVKKYNYIL